MSTELDNVCETLSQVPAYNKHSVNVTYYYYYCTN